MSVTLLCASALAAKLPFAQAGTEVCPCVLIIEVDGLEPKDISRELTPFLYELAHPQGSQTLGPGRAGWTWQAPRGVMGADSAAGAASLLTGAYPEASGVPANEFIGDGETVRLESSPQDGAKQITEGDIRAKSLLTSVSEDTEGQKKTAGFVGNPALAGLVNGDGDTGGVSETATWWYPKNDDPEAAPSPAYCDVPRRTPDDPAYQPQCSAPDLTTLNAALAQLNTDEADDVALSYIHLAELGVIKRRDGDLLGASDPTDPSGASGVDVPRALGQLDGSLRAFFTQLRDETNAERTAAKWADTFVFVVGNHGYETTLQHQRVPAGDDGSGDLEEYIEQDGGLEFIPQGTMATIQATSNDPATRRTAIQSAFAKLKNRGPVEQTAACGDPDPGPSAGADTKPGQTQDGGCIAELLYMRGDLVPPEEGEGFRKEHLITEAHPGWRLDHLDAGLPTRTSGDLLILTEPGWSTGRAAPSQMTDSDEEDPGPVPITDVTNPYTGSAGGPRNRAIAAIVNGPAGGEGVRQVAGDAYPVTKEADEGELDETPEPEYATVSAANANPSDDADADGHERQLETVDIAPTIAALLQVKIEDEQLHGRFLQEAFLRPLAFPVDEVVEPEPEPEIIEEPPPPPEPEVIIIPPPPVEPPPPPPPSWDFDGLLANVKAGVGDKKGRLFPKWGSKARLEYLVITADFGKPLSSVKLTFYKKRTDRAGASARTVVKTLASFDAFSIKRSRQAKLTLKVPPVFSPTHVGIVVQEARMKTKRELRKARQSGEKKVAAFTGIGEKIGGIYTIKDANHLHKVAPKRKAERKPNKKPKKRRSAV